MNRQLQILYINLGDIGTYSYDKQAGRILGWAKQGNSVNLLVSELGRKTASEEIINKDPVHARLLTLPFSGKEANSAIKIIFSYFLRVCCAPLILFKKLPTFDFAVSNSCFLVDIVPVFWLKIFKKCKGWVLIMDSIVPSPKEREGNFLINLLAYSESIFLGKIANLFADLIFTVNPELKKEMIKRGIGEKKIIFSENGLFMEKINLVKNPKKKKYEAAYMGRISVNKGVFDLIEVWRELIKEKPKARLAIMGGGLEDVVEKLKKEIKKNELEKNIEYLGFTSAPKKYQVLKNSRIFLYLSKVNADESWGISLMEALACGVPAISYNLPIYEHIYKTKSLIRVECNKVKSVITSLKFLLEDEKTYALLSRGSVNFAKKFDWFKIAQKDLIKIRKTL
ncbi:MAG: glycosyltransferase [Candidatus Shapirobacteria bacterium]